jgi:lipoprotein-anchoring transpeptidase ErfK/SrfK
MRYWLLLLVVGLWWVAAPGAVHAQTASPAKEIVIQLGAQSLTAYADGVPVLQTPVTTGRAGLRTPTGYDSVFAHYTPYLFISPWGPDSPYWYPPSWVNWAMEFHAGGYFIHDAPWEPSWAFGPGSEDGPYASHGCVHVPYWAMQFLFSWTPNETPVVVTE